MNAAQTVKTSKLGMWKLESMNDTPGLVNADVRMRQQRRLLLLIPLNAAQSVKTSKLGMWTLEGMNDTPGDRIADMRICWIGGGYLL